MLGKAIEYHTGHQKLGRCSTRGESQEPIALHAGNEAHKLGIHSAFEIQCRRHHKKFKTGVLEALEKDLCPLDMARFVCFACVSKKTESETSEYNTV